MLRLVLVASIVGYATCRLYEAALFLSGEIQTGSDVCGSLWCSVTLKFHLWAGYLCAPLAVAALVLLAKSARVSSMAAAGFLLTMLASDLAALVALWHYYGPWQSFWGPHRDNFLIARLVVPAIGAVAALLVWKRGAPARRAA